MSAATGRTVDGQLLLAVGRDQPTPTPRAVVARLDWVGVGVCVERPLDGRPHGTLPGRSEFVPLFGLSDKVPRQLAEMVVELRTVVHSGALAECRETDWLLVCSPERFQNLDSRLVANQRKRLRGPETVLRISGEFHRLQSVHTRYSPLTGVNSSRNSASNTTPDSRSPVLARTTDFLQLSLQNISLAMVFVPASRSHR